MKDYDIIFTKALYFLLSEAKISELDTRDWTELRNGFANYIQRQSDEEKPTKKYRVNLYYDTMYQVEVEAESEEEAVEKARELANDNWGFCPDGTFTE